MNNEIKINVPEGMEIDKENSTFECIKFKPKWIPKKGDIAAAGNDDHCQIILVDKYIRQGNIVGFDVDCLAVMDIRNKLLTLFNDEESDREFWVLEEASDSEKKEFINELNKQGYVYNPSDPRIIYKKEKELPKTWKEFCQNNPVKKDEEYYITSFSLIKSGNIEDGDRIRESIHDSNLLPSEEYAEALLALCKLIQLRDCYNDGWKPDWKSTSPKFIIRIYSGVPVSDTVSGAQSLLAFKTRKLREAFLNNFRDLIEQAKLLL